MKSIDKIMEELIQKLALDEESHRLRRDFLGFTEEDGSRLKALHPHISSFYPQFIDSFYQQLIDFEKNRRFLQEEATVEFLKKNHTAYFNNLTTGIYDKDYISSRLKIALLACLLACAKIFPRRNLLISERVRFFTDSCGCTREAFRM